MKRLHILFGLTLVCLSMPNVVWGRNCKPVGCSESGGNDDIVASTLKQEDASSRQAYCYVCEKGYCEDGDIVFLNDYSMFKSCNQSGGWHDDQWEIYTPAQCSKEVVKNKENAIYLSTNTTKGQDYINQLNLTEKKYNIVGTDYDGSSNNIFSSVVKKETVPCMYYVCKNGYMPNSDKTECIADTRKDDCERNSGTWNNGQCTCDSNKHLTLSTDKLTCVCADGYVDASNEDTKKLECVASQETIAEQNAKKCRNSGGQWQNDGCVCNSNKNLTKSGDVCVCKQGYEYKSNKADGCKITQATVNAQNKDKCENSKQSGQPVEWDNVTNTCYCNGGTGQYHEIRDNGTIYHCEETEEYNACKKLGSKATWYEGRCTCKDKTKQFLEGNCNTNTEDYDAQLAAEAAAAAADKLSKEIEKIGKTLDAVTDTFEISKWRNADGEFNTARLASDSVAAVVLGTAGGLISSKVIKKKQIEDGFEDIKCIIGSQTVADYGDEFQVGIQ